MPEPTPVPGDTATSPGEMLAPTLTAGNGQVTVTWVAPTSNGGSAITAYNLRHSTDGGTNWTEVTDVIAASAASHDIMGLDNGTPYTVQARAVNDVGAGAWSPSSTSATPVTVPMAPTNLVLTVGDDQLTAAWTAPTDIGGSSILRYEAQHRIAGTHDAWTPNPIATPNGATLTLEITGLTNGTSYEVQVYAVNEQGNGNPIVGTATPDVAPAAPAAPTIDVGNAQLVVNWAAPPTDNGGTAITGYELQYSSDGGTSWTLIEASEITGTNHTITALTNSTAYVVQVRAVNSAGAGDWSDSTTATPIAVPDAPTGLILTAGNTQLNASWTAPVDVGDSAITGYKVQYRSDGGTTWTESSGVTGTSHTITGLTNGTSYEVQVRAVNMQGDGPWSEPATAMVPIIATQVPAGTAASAILSADIDTIIANQNPTVSLTTIESNTLTVDGSGDITAVTPPATAPAGATLPTVDASTGVITVAADTTAGTYVVYGIGTGDALLFAEYFYVTVSPNDATAAGGNANDDGGNDELDAAVAAGISNWGQTADLNYIVTTAVTDMSEVFKNKSSFNGDISGWDVSSVMNMSTMFSNADTFSSDISGWDVSSVMNMSAMFNSADVFNANISGWSTDAVEDMSHMFRNAIIFNHDISSWDVSSVMNMSTMFSYAAVFNQDISGWNVSSVANMAYMFSYAAAFNKNIDAWATNPDTTMPWGNANWGNDGKYKGSRAGMFINSGLSGSEPSWWEAP